MLGLGMVSGRADRPELPSAGGGLQPGHVSWNKCSPPISSPAGSSVGKAE